MTPVTLMLAILLLPLAGAAGILLTSRAPNIREGITLVTAGAIAALVLTMAGRFLNGEPFALNVIEPFPV